MTADGMVVFPAAASEGAIPKNHSRRQGNSPGMSNK